MMIYGNVGFGVCPPPPHPPNFSVMLSREKLSYNYNLSNSQSKVAR